MKSLSIKVREGAFTTAYGPGLQRGMGSSGAGSLGLLAYILSRGRKKPKSKKDPNILKLLQILKTLKTLGMIDQLKWPVEIGSD